MKKLGLIGGTGPESTIIYYKQITEMIQKQTGNFPNLTIESLSVFDVLNFMDHQNYAGLAEYLLTGITALKGSGADLVALTGITPHIVIEQLKKYSPLPIVSMLDTTRDYLQANHYHNVLLMGTAQTLQAKFFQDYLTANGIKVILPTSQEIDYIGNKIETELELGQVLPQTQTHFAEITQRLIDSQPVDALILGCTELPLIFRDLPLPVPKVDVMNEHINQLVKLIS